MLVIIPIGIRSKYSPIPQLSLVFNPNRGTHIPKCLPTPIFFHAPAVGPRSIRSFVFSGSSFLMSCVGGGLGIREPRRLKELIVATIRRYNKQAIGGAAQGTQKVIVRRTKCRVPSHKFYLHKRKFRRLTNDARSDMIVKDLHADCINISYIFLSQ